MASGKRPGLLSVSRQNKVGRWVFRSTYPFISLLPLPYIRPWLPCSQITMRVFVSVSFSLLWQKYPRKTNNKEGKVRSDSCCQRFQAMVTWPHGPLGVWCIVVEGCGKERYLLMETGKQRKEGPWMNMSFQSTSPVTHTLQLDSLLILPK